MDQSELEEIRQIEQKVKEEHENRDLIWNIVKSLRGKEELKNFITFESVPLYPLLEEKNDNYILSILLSVPKDNKKLNNPWGWVKILLSDQSVIAKEKIDSEIIDENLELSNNLICDKKFAHLLQKSIENDSKIVLPPEKLLQIYKSINKTDYTFDKDKYIEFSNTEMNIKSENKKKEKQESIEVSSDLDKTLKIKKELKDLLLEFDNKELLKKFQQISKKISQPHFSVAVVGEFNRGKTTFINNLLGEEILPTGKLPTTAMLTKVIHGPEKRLYRVMENKKERIELNNWKDLTADREGNDPEGKLILELPNEFLKKSQIKLIDTPGAGDLIGERAKITTEVIASCDATLITIDATMPFSLTEKSFIEDNILMKRIPRVAIIITKMDQIDESEREAVYKHIQESANNLSENIFVWVANDSIEKLNSYQAAGIGEIGKEINKWSQSSQNRDLRNEQIQLQYFDLIKIISSTVDKKLEILHENENERKEKIKNGKFMIKKEARFWKDFKLEIEKREIDFSNWFKNKIEPKKSDLIKESHMKVDNKRNLQKWSEEYFPYYLKTKLTHILKGLESEIERKISKDIRWLKKQVQKKYEKEFNINLNKIELSGQFKNNLGDEIVKSDSENVNNLGKKKKYARMGISAGRLLLFGINPIVGIVGGIGGSVLNEKYFKNKLNTQKQEVKQNVTEVIDEIFDEIPEKAQDRISKVYSFVIKDIKHNLKLWKKSREQELEKNISDNNEDEIEKYNEFKNRLNQLIEYIKG